jgi:hypothetical protein
MLVIVDLQTAFHTDFIVMFMICLHTKFHMPLAASSLVIAIKPEAEENFCLAAIL